MEDIAKRIRYDTDLLNEVVVRDSAILVDTYDNPIRTTKISFNCKCGNVGTKTLLCSYKYGMLCKSCTIKSKSNKIKKTNLEKYGVTNQLHRKDIREKIIKTNKEKYGTDYGVQSKIVQDKMKKTNLEKYGVEHIINHESIKLKTKETLKERYGVTHPSQIEGFMDKVKKTHLEKYGVEYTMQYKEFKEKSKKTSLERYGKEYASQSKEFQDKIKSTCMSKYGVANSMLVPEIREKIKKTNLERYGVENPAQNKEVMEKTQRNAKKYKEYTLPSGKVIKVQGYEPFALSELLKIYKEDDILTNRTDIPTITYKVEDKTRYYFPDIYIPSINKIIEVKSTWTYKCKSDSIHQKAEATKAAGYEYEIWVFDAKGNRVPV